MLVNGVDEGADALRVHVGVKAVAQVGDVAPGAETLQHLLHNVSNALLEEEIRKSGDYASQRDDASRQFYCRLTELSKHQSSLLCCLQLKLGIKDKKRKENEGFPSQARLQKSAVEEMGRGTERRTWMTAKKLNQSR